MPNVPLYSAPIKAIGQLGLTGDLNAAYAQLAAVTLWINGQTGGTTPPANVIPTANAGADNTITLPTSTVQLSGSGSDGDGTITGYTWTQTAGPNTATFSSKVVASPTVSGLIAGIYKFSLVTTDNQGATSQPDEVILTVNAATATQLAAPTGGSATPNGANTLRITGTLPAGATGYKVYRSATQNGSYAQVGGTMATFPFDNTGLTASSTYWYKLQALGNGSSYTDSALSAAFSGTVQAATPTPPPTFAPPQALALDSWVATRDRVDLSYTPTTTLAQPASAGATTLPVADASALPVYCQLQLGTEVVNVTAVAGNVLTLAAALTGSYAAGQAVGRAVVQQMRHLREGAETTIAARQTVESKRPLYMRNLTTGATWASFDGVDDLMSVGVVLGPDYTEFFVGQFYEGGGSYILSASGVNSYPALLANVAPGQLSYYMEGEGHTDIKEGATNLFVVAIRNKAGGKRTYWYADTQNPTPVVVAEVDASTTPSHNGNTRNGIGNNDAQGPATKLDFFQHSLYGQVALSDAEVTQWLDNLTTRYLGASGPSEAGSYPDSYQPTY